MKNSLKDRRFEWVTTWDQVWDPSFVKQWKGLMKRSPDGYEKKAVIQDNWKLIHSDDDKVSLLFDLDKDPNERHDLAQVRPDIVVRLKAALPTEVAKGEALKVTRDVEDQLRHLGYM